MLTPHYYRYVPGETLGFHFDERPTCAQLHLATLSCIPPLQLGTPIHTPKPHPLATPLSHTPKPCPLATRYAELIVGLSVCGQGRLLLGHTNGSKEVAPRALQQLNVRAIDLPPGSLYCLTGMSRYDLRHAVVHDGAAERISVTFRALK